jgi:hypothetical protein
LRSARVVERLALASSLKLLSKHKLLSDKSPPIGGLFR